MSTVVTLNEYSSYGAVMFPVVYPGANKIFPTDAHLTLMYFGDVTLRSEAERKIIRTCMSEVEQGVYRRVYVTEKDWFGPDHDVAVLRTENRHIHAYRQHLEELLTAEGIPWDTTHKEFKPHVTVTPWGAELDTYPEDILLAPAELWWEGKKYQV
jgi:2'-5' RNA ligase